MTFPISQDGALQTIDLPRGPHIEFLSLRVSGTINNTVTWAGGVRDLAPYQFLRRLDWVLNSNVTLDSISGTQAAQHFITRRQTPPSVIPVAAAGATSFEANFFIDRAMMDGVRPKDSYLKTDVGIANNQLRLQFGNLSDMFLTGAGSATYTAVTGTVIIGDYQEARDAQGNTPAPIFYQKRNGQRVTLSSAGNGQQVKINTGNRLRYISMRVLDATTGEPNAALVTNLKVMRAGDTRVDITSNELRRLNQATYGVASLTGQYVIDLANVGSNSGVPYSEFWPVPSSADTYLLIDTTAACILDLTTLEGVDLIN
jgi:hypothetical protein